MSERPELFSRRLMARSLAYLFTVGAGVGCLTLVFPHDAAIRTEPLYGLAAMAVTLGLVVLRFSERMPMWGFHLAVACGTAILAAANYYVGPSAQYPIIFTWTALYAFYFFRLLPALAHVGLIGLGYAIVLVLQDPSSPLVRWVLAIGTPMVAGLLISTLLERVRGEAVQSARQEQVLRESEARNRAIVQSAPDAFMALDEDGSVVSWNAAAERTFGWSADEVLGRPVRELVIPSEDREAHDGRWREELERPDGESRPSRREVELLRRDGSLFPAEVSVSRVPIEDRSMLVCFVRNMSDRDERERERQELYREQAAREEAEQMASLVHSLQVLVDAALAHNRLDEMLEALLPRICEVVNAEFATILLSEEDGSLVARASTAGLPEEPVRIRPGEGIAGRVARDRTPLLVQDPAPDEPVDPALRSYQSILNVPLMAGSTITGVLQVGVPAPRRFSDEDLLLLGLAADRVALAIDHLRVYEREHRIAETLQRSLLPERLPRVPGLEVAARYLPAASEAEVGGDWYDVIPVAGRVGLVMGDVAGKGLAAASMVGQLRSTMRAYALEGHPPAEVVDRLNQLVWSEAGESQMVTLLYAVLDPIEGKLEWVNAGHLPPLAVSSDGLTRFMQGPSSVPLGVMPFPSYETATADLKAGDSVVLYTDGLVERVGELIDLGLDRLAATVRGKPRSPEELCSHVLSALVPAGGVADDVALLVLRNPQLSKRLELELSSDPSELASMRALLRRWLRQECEEDSEIAEILTATGEAAANAIEHGGSSVGGLPFEVLGTLDGGEVDITVRDRGTWVPEGNSDGGRGLVLMRALMDTVEVTPASGGTTVRMRRRLANAAGGLPAQPQESGSATG